MLKLKPSEESIINAFGITEEKVISIDNLVQGLTQQEFNIVEEIDNFQKENSKEETAFFIFSLGSMLGASQIISFIEASQEAEEKNFEETEEVLENLE